MWRVAGLALLGLLLAGTAVGCESPAGLAGLRAELLDLTNSERVSAGLVALTRDPRLEAAAQTQACRTAARDRVSHRGSWFAGLGRRLRREGYRYAVAVENLAAGQRTAVEVHRAWMTSAGHRVNTLDPRTRDVGYGIARADNGWLHWSMVAAARP
jgi:uncharacterized protein YkwD